MTPADFVEEIRTLLHERAKAGARVPAFDLRGMLQQVEAAFVAVGDLGDDTVAGLRETVAGLEKDLEGLQAENDRLEMRLEDLEGDE